MIRMFLFSTALAVSAPAMAQMTPPADQGATPASPDATMPSDPAMTQDAQPEQAAPAEPATGANAVAQIVESEFPAYDSNKDGQLDQAEFSRWMLALKDQEMKATGQTLPPEQVTAWANGAFTTADADKSTSVSKPELITYLSGAAAG